MRTRTICLAIAVIGLVTAECAAQRRLAWPEYDGPFPFVQKEVDAIGTFNFDSRMTIRENLNSIAFRLLRTPRPEVLKTKVLPDLVTTVRLYDRDSDGSVDMFIASESRSTQDFWFIFDLNRDGRTDYAIFNGGVWPDRDFRYHWFNYHYVDSNNDGKVDLLIYTADMDGDRFFNEDVGAWLYDFDHDGTIDKGEYLGRDLVEPLPEEDGSFVVKESGGEIRVQKKSINAGLAFSSRLLSLVDSLITLPQ